MVIFGTRPEAIKLAPVILEMQESGSGFEPFVCVTGQHREMLDPVLEWFGIRPDHDLALMKANQVLSDLAGRALSKLGETIARTEPQLVLVQGDTTTAAVGALAAFYHRVPVGHVEAGLRTGERYNPFPEEINRRLAGVLTNYHFAPTESAAAALRAEQVDPASIFLVGNTVTDALRLTLGRQSEVSAAFELTGRRMVLVTAHRRESFGAPFENLCRAIRTIADLHPDVDLVYPVHLNPNVREPVQRLLSGHPRIRLIEPVRYEQFACLLSQAHLILTDSGGIQEEATMLGKPTLVMRDTTERPEAVKAGTAVLVGTDSSRIENAAHRVLSDDAAYALMARKSAAFGDGYASRKIADVLRKSL